MRWPSFFKRKFTYSFSEYLTSTRLHIARCLNEKGWRHIDTPHKALLQDEHLNLDDSIAAHLEQKHLLWTLLLAHQLDYMPPTFPVNDLTYPKVLEDMAAFNFDAETIWFLKPALLNNGDHIYLYDNLDDIAAYFKNPSHLEGEHVIQKAVHPPALIQGKKFTFRMSVVMTNEPSAYLYDMGYLNISSVPYQEGEDLSFKKRHITNYLIEGEIAGITQILSQDYPRFNQDLRPQIAEMIKTLILALQATYPKFMCYRDKPQFELFGFDFMLDANNRLWLLEVNQGPDFPVDPEHPLFKVHWDPFWHRLTEDFVLPLFPNVVKTMPSRSHWIRLF